MDNIRDTLVEIPQKKKWPDCRSMVNVVFLDGEVREYEISASSHLSKYLVEQASETGILCFIDKRQKASLSIPVANIREWSLKEIEEAPAEPAPENQPHCIDGLSDKIMDAMESKALGVNTNQMLKTKAINIVETELRRHGSAAVLKRSKRDWMRVDHVGEKAAMFIRSALFDLRKRGRQGYEEGYEEGYSTGHADNFWNKV
jgi:hypothetical protein